MLVLGVAMLSLFLVGCSNNSKNNNRTKDTARAEMDVEAIFENKQHKDLIDNTQRSDIDTVKEEVDKLPTSTHKRTLIKEINHAYTLLPRLKKHEKSESISESVKAVQASKKAASIKEAKKEYSRNASNPDAYNGSTPEESSASSSSATSYDTTGISDIAIEDTIKQNVSDVKVKEVSGEYHKPVTTGIDINVKDSSDYYDEGTYKKDAYHILLAIKDDYGFSDFKNITITFYMDGDALVKSSFDQSALKQINHKDSNYYNIDSVATEWNADNLNAKYNQ
ncbi:toxin Cry1Ac domain D-VI-related protein [Lactiplantibacillus plantarum]|uniref:toxin Cry1Ac domain D-VI-related protein n=1 Tax=Lactiplantibacillus plantarum TaxID=1590 RepID=UPI003D302A87